MAKTRKPRERRFSVNGIQLAAQEWGEDGQLPVIALHGWLDNSASFDKLLPLLPDAHVIALDMTGHGQSDHRPGQAVYSVWDDIRDIFAVADDMGWQQFTLLGHSRGAIISTLAAGTFPERIHSLALIEGFVPEAASAQDAPRQLAKAINELASAIKKPRTIYPDIETAIRAREKGMFPLSYSAAKSITLRGIKTVEGGFAWTYDPKLFAPSMIKLNGDYIRAFVDTIKAPVCLLLANDGLPKFYTNYLQQMQQYPAIKYRLLEGGHHLHTEEQAAEVAGHIRDFFHQHPANE
jgi:pimeloyl-ACP methyl ester carboxylesterase